MVGSKGCQMYIVEFGLPFKKGGGDFVEKFLAVTCHFPNQRTPTQTGLHTVCLRCFC